MGTKEVVELGGSSPHYVYLSKPVVPNRSLKCDVRETPSKLQ